MDTTTIVLLVLIVVLLVAYPILVSARNKKEKQKFQEMSNSLKRGDKVLTASGIYGTIVDLHMEGERQLVTIETGKDKHKGYMSIDVYAIYSIIPEEVKEDEAKKEVESTAKTTENAADKAEPVVEPEQPVENNKKKKGKK